MLLLVLVIVVIAVVMISGPLLSALGDALGLGGTALAVWSVLRWPVLALAVVVMIAVLYKGTGNLRLPRFRWLSLGAVLAIAVMAASSVGFGFYVSNFAAYNQTFGTFAGVVVFLIWLFLINIALLLGVEFNAEIERGRQLQAGIAAESRIALPPRDTALSERSERSARITEQRGAMLRRGEELPARTDTLFARLRAKARELRDRMR